MATEFAASSAGRSRLPMWIGIGLAVALGAAGTMAAVLTDRHVAVNDFWGNALLAAHVRLWEPSTWFSGFFPLGYHVLLSGLPSAHLVTTAFAASVTAGAITTALVGAAVSRWLSAGWGILAGLALATWPIFFAYTTTPGPDLLAVGLATSGVLLLLDAIDADAPARRVAAAGALLGLACLFRYHFVFIAAGASLAWAVWRGLRSRSTIALLAAVAATAGVQIVVNLLSGHGLFGNAQGLNVTRMMYGLDWSSLSHTTPIPGVASVIAADPWRFATAYARACGGLLPYALPAVLSVAVAWRQPLIRRRSLVLAVTQATYILAVSVASSSRAVLPLLPLTVLSTAILGSGLAGRWSRAGQSTMRAAAAGCVVILLVPIGLNALADARATHRRAEAHRSLVELEALLRQAGVRSPSEVFTTDLSVYLPGLPPHVPWTNGGWYRIDLPDYDVRYPSLCVSSLACLVSDATAHGLRTLVLPSGSRTSAGVPWTDEALPSGAHRLAAPAAWTVLAIDR